jgi:cytochrome c biogenesis protein CcmG/thiol:disulfide interchange protein DsbE
MDAARISRRPIVVIIGSGDLTLVHLLSRRALAAGIIAAALFAASCAKAPSDEVSAASVKPDAQRKLAPDFSLKDSDGKTVKLSDYKGKVVLLNFWATWCGPCKIEIPWFIEFEQKYKDKGFAVVGISMDEDGWKAVKPYMAEKHINYRMAIGDDSLGSIYGGVDSLPTSFVIDKTGRIAATHIGLVSKSDYQHEIEQLLGGNAGIGSATHASLGTN